ncbi:MAG: pentapeptide repeat-containing protein [Streptococcaceae bacterium]|nr:pentapeptide repeat-containing protein [Streptococcaceae bacterium]
MQRTIYNEVHRYYHFSEASFIGASFIGASFLGASFLKVSKSI